jgi:uncharacterized protein
MALWELFSYETEADFDEAVRTSFGGEVNIANRINFLLERPMTIFSSADIPDTMRSPEKKKPKGFAALTPEKRREIASKGGKAAHAKGTAHEFDSEEARSAGRKGGHAISRNRDYMAEIGSRGGLSKASNHQMKKINGEKEVDRTNRY